MSVLGNSVTQQAFTPAVDVYSGNGSTVAFTLSRPVASVAQVEAFIENVPQSPVDAFTVNGNVITFTSAPPSGSSNIYVRYTSPITQVITPTDGTVSLSSFSSPVMSAISGMGFKNRIINGAMVIDQRNAGASVTPINGQYSVDRWSALLNQSSKFSLQQNAGAVTPPSGFTNYLGATSLSSYSVASGDILAIRQQIEGLNVGDLGWGAAGAQSITLSFWVRSSLTGAFGGALQNNAQDYSFPFSFTISSSNTWEYKTVSISGPTSGTWLTTNSVGIRLHFSLGAGTTYLGTAGAWAAQRYESATGATSVVGTSGATFYITGVQLEKGSTATSFDYRPYGTELQLCQRYYQRSTSGGSNYCHLSNWGSNASTTTLRCTYPLKTSLRAAPSSVDFSNLCVDDNATAPAVTGLAIYNTAAENAVALQATVASGLTTFRPAIIANVSGVGYIGISAEL